MDLERLHESPQARVWLSLSVPPDEATSLLLAALGDESWNDFQVQWAWLNAGWSLEKRSPGAGAVLAEAVVERALTGAVENHRLILPRLGDFLEDHAPKLRSSICEWIVDKGDPGDAEAAIGFLRSQLLGEQTPNDAPELSAFVHLAGWLLDNGGSALRSGTLDPFFMVALLDLLRRHAPERVELALRYIVRNENGAQVWLPDATATIWQSLEVCLARGDGRGLLSDLLSLPGASWNLGRDAFFAPLYDDTLAECRTEMLHEIGAGSFSRHRLQEGWSILINGFSPPIGLQVSGDSLLTCASALLDVARPGTSDFHEWARFVASEFLRQQEFHRPRGILDRDPSRLVNLATWPALQSGIRAALEDAIAKGLANAPLSRDILAEHESPSVITAALHALPPATGAPARSTPIIQIADFEHELTRIVSLPWSEPILGVDLGWALKGVRSARVTEISSDDQVLLRPPELLVADGYLRRLIEEEVSPERCLMSGLIYVVHEWIHVLQAMGDKRAVLEFRKAGEFAVMHFDLAADHMTTMILSRAMPRWSLLDLKDHTGRSLENFPVTASHPRSAVERKSVRLVSLRADYLARRHRWLSNELPEGGYVYADYPPGAGTLALVLAGSLPKVLDARSVEPAITKKLADAARPPIDVDKIDRLLIDLWGKKHQD